MDERLGGLELGDNIETLFKVQTPLTPAPSKFGYVGVLLRNKLTDRIQCHICGKWFRFLAPHLKIAHQSSTVEYRKEFSLPINFPLCSRKFSKKRSENIRCSKDHMIMMQKKLAEMRKNGFQRAINKKHKKGLKYYYNTEAHKNKNGFCDEQIRSRYLIVCETLGHEPSHYELRIEDNSLAKKIQYKYKNYSIFRKKFGYSKPAMRTTLMYTDESLIAVLRAYYKKYGRVPVAKSFYARSPSITAFRNHFGSWSRALQSAGFIKK